MKKSFLTFVFICAATLFSTAQNKQKSNSNTSDKGPHAFKKGGIDLNLGLGLGSNWGRHYASYMPPLSLAADFGVTNNVSIGGFLAYSRAKWKYVGNDVHQGNLYNYSYSYNYKFYIVGVRGAYHFGDLIKEEKLDAYVGGMLGNSFLRYSFTYEDPYKQRVDVYSQSYGGGFVWGLYGGGRYFLSDNIGLYGEFGWGVSYANIGLTIKLK